MLITDTITIFLADASRRHAVDTDDWREQNVAALDLTLRARKSGRGKRKVYLGEGCCEALSEFVTATR